MPSPTTEQIVKDHMKATARLRRELDTVQKMRQFLIEAGIAVKSKSAPNGIRLAKRYR